MEILVTVLVLSVTLTAIYQSFGTTVFINESTEKLWKAMAYAENELARVEREATPGIAVRQGEFPPDHEMAGYSWEQEVSDKEPFPGVRVRQIRYALTWRITNINQTHQAVTYVPVP